MVQWAYATKRKLNKMVNRNNRNLWKQFIKRILHNENHEFYKLVRKQALNLYTRRSGKKRSNLRGFYSCIDIVYRLYQYIVNLIKRKSNNEYKINKRVQELQTDSSLQTGRETGILVRGEAQNAQIKNSITGINNDRIQRIDNDLPMSICVIDDGHKLSSTSCRHAYENNRNQLEHEEYRTVTVDSIDTGCSRQHDELSEIVRAANQRSRERIRLAEERIALVDEYFARRNKSNVESKSRTLRSTTD